MLMELIQQKVGLETQIVYLYLIYLHLGATEATTELETKTATDKTGDTIDQQTQTGILGAWR